MLTFSCHNLSSPGWAQGLLSHLSLLGHLDAVGTGITESLYFFFFQLSSICQLVLGVVERADHLAREKNNKKIFFKN